MTRFGACEHLGQAGSFDQVIAWLWQAVTPGVSCGALVSV